MRYLLSVLLVALIFIFQSCKDGDATTNAPAAAPTSAPMTNTASSAGGVEHYACPNGHVGKGGDAAGTCSECGATLEHNSAFHDNEPPAQETDIVENADPNAPAEGTNPGVEHYICPNGHVGSGGDAAGTCSDCGADLQHNDAFHSTPPPADLVNQVNNIDPSAETVPPPSAPAGNAGVEHYICPNGHVGSGGAGEGTCSQCQAALVHNDAFHNTPVDAGAGSAIPNVATQEQIIPQPSGALSPVFQNAGTAAPTVGGGAGAPALEPAQNSVGVWHYVCPDGHSGGAGSEQPCGQCGKTLVHNTIYHQ